MWLYVVQFFYKSKFTLENFRKIPFHETFDIIIIFIIFINYLFTVSEKVSHNLEKRLIKVSQKGGKIIYLYKSVNINFSITFTILSTFQGSSFRKVK